MRNRDRACGDSVNRVTTAYKISDAARLLGVSDDTVRRWVDQGLLPVTDASPAEIPGDALAERAVELARAADDPTSVLSSARNRFTGLVTRVQRDGVMAQVDIQSGPHRIVSLMSSEAVADLGLEVGSLAVAVVKATTVIVETPRS
ncbi:MAG: TOBE domain-containing protein [Microbacterium sp.]|nr:TOBE domain-containing protein [Microbacterium sp.]MBN9173681.1 TOBE domain-containing protein [Microbacterium sp.]